MTDMAAPIRPRGQYREDPANATTKRCPKCEMVKSVDEFHKNRAAVDGRQSYCKACMSASFDHEKARAYWKKKHADPVERRKQAVRNRKAMLRREYGITPEQYDEMLVAQSGRCSLCLVEISPHKWLAVDHDHTTGRVRGLLCNHCNTSLHKLETIPGWIERAAKHLNPFIQ